MTDETSASAQTETRDAVEQTWKAVLQAAIDDHCAYPAHTIIHTCPLLPALAVHEAAIRADERAKTLDDAQRLFVDDHDAFVKLHNFIYAETIAKEHTDAT